MNRLAIMSHEDLSIFVRWESLLDWLLNATEKFPKRVRHTFSNRMDNMALDITERIIEAAYPYNDVYVLPLSFFFRCDKYAR
jgi:hypothetical protein